jgi:hypothetical protein
MKQNFRELSKKNWLPKDKERSPTDEELKTGCLQRIADAAELMATNFLKLQSDNEYYKKRVQTLHEELESTKRSAAAYKGKFNSTKKLKES